MTSSCRDVLADAFAALGVISFGGEPTADEIEGGLAAIQKIVLDLHAARDPLKTVDVGNDYIASENQRVRVEAGATVNVTLPNSIVPLGVSANQTNIGHLDGATDCLTTGSISAADGRLSCAPRDGARIEIVGVAQALYFYRADTNAWIVAEPLIIDGPTPLNARYDSALAALVAERLCDPMNVLPSPTLVRRIARANAALMLQTATSSAPIRSAYF